MSGLRLRRRPSARAARSTALRRYRRARDAGRLWAPIRLAEAMSMAPLGLDDAGRLADLVPAGADVEALVCQRLLDGLLLTRLLPGLLAHAGAPATPVAVGLPPAWRATLRGEGVVVPELADRVAWVRSQLWHGTRGLRRIGSLAAVALRGERAPGRPYALIPGLTEENLPSRDGSGERRTFTTWYLGLGGRRPEVEVVRAVVRGSTREDRPPQVQRVGSELVRLPVAAVAPWLLSSLGLAARAVGHAVRGRWWWPVLLADLVEVDYVRRCRPGDLPSEVVVHNGMFLVKPLWLDELESRGAWVSLAYYSINTELIDAASQDGPRFYPGYRRMSWNRYLVWDQRQQAYLHELGHGCATIEQVGPVEFSDGDEPVPPAARGAVAVFDVEPQDIGALGALGLSQGYYATRNAVCFVTDVEAAVRSVGGRLAFKRKRDIGDRGAPAYRRCLEQLAVAEHVIQVDPSTAASRLIDQASAVVSMPYTATAVMARDLGRPSVFYDPTGRLREDDPAARGIPVLSGRDELTSWLRTATAGEVVA